MAKIPREGLIKLVRPQPADISSADRAALIRRGNQLFNSGDYDTAKKIFLSLGYSDGLTRLGDHYYKETNYMEAFRMYKLAPAPDKAAAMVKKLASIVQDWIR